MKTLFTTFLFLQSFIIFGQGCAIDNSQNQVGIYPDTLPTGIVGQYYSQDITFVLPLDTMGFDFTNFQILAVALPVGLDWSCNNTNTNCNYIPQVSNHGCIQIFGTPLLTGNYTVQVSVLADLTILNGYPFVFELPLQISPPSFNNVNNGFSVTGAPACAPALIEFNNLHPGLLHYHWDFGNGNFSSAENPTPQYYEGPGTYFVQYEAYTALDTTFIYTLENLTINSMTNFGGSFPSFESADAYFKIRENGTLIYQSSIIGDQNPPVFWTLNLNINPNSSYNIEIWEADDSYGEPYFGADDYIGSQALNLNGCAGCMAGTANINYLISQFELTPAPAILAIDTIVVYPTPDAPNINFDSLSHTVSTPDLGFYYQWYFNDSPIPGATNPDLIIEQSGNYSIVAVNNNGCVAFSDTLTAIYCNPFIQPTISHNNGAIYITNVVQNATFSWFLDGQIIPNAQSHTFNYIQNGSYQCIVTDPYGCIYTSSILLIDAGNQMYSFEDPKIFPNPAKDILFVSLPDPWLGSSLEIIDLFGKVVYHELSIKQAFAIPLNTIQSGTYLIRFSTQNTQYQKLICISAAQ